MTVAPERAAAEALERIAPRLRRQWEELLGAIAAGRTNDDDVRWSVATIVAGIKQSRRRYGATAVHALAAARGCSRATLYRDARVASCWTRVAVARLLARGGALGAPLTWSHLVALTEVCDARRREVLLERVFEERLGVRAIRRALRARVALTPPAIGCRHGSRSW